MRYGGNTACVEVRSGDDIIILDAGSGLRTLGRALLAEFLDERLAQKPQAGAGVENDDFVAAADLDAGSVAAQTHRVPSRRGNGAADAPKFDARARFDGESLAQTAAEIKLF